MRWTRRRVLATLLAAACPAAALLAITVLLRPVAVGRAGIDLLLRARGFIYRPVPVDDLSTLALIEKNPDGADAVVFLHGFLSEARIWTPVLLRMEGDRRLLAIDLPGSGRAGPMPDGTTVASLAASVATLLDRVGVDGAVVVGNSLGGWIGMRIALDRPDLVSALVLVNSAGILFPPPPRSDVLPVTVGQFERAWTLMHGRMQPPPRFVIRDLMRERDRRAAEGLFERMASGEDLLDDRLGAIDRPALVVWGAADRLIHPGVGRRLAAALPEALYREIPDCGHVPPVECPGELSEILTGFLEGPDAPGGKQRSQPEGVSLPEK